MYIKEKLEVGLQHNNNSIRKQNQKLVLILNCTFSALNGGQTSNQALDLATLIERENTEKGDDKS